MYVPTESDLSTISPTVEQAAEKYLELAAGKPTPLLRTLKERLLAITKGRDFRPAKPGFRVRLFSAGGVTARDVIPEVRMDEFAERFDEVQCPVFAGSLGDDYRFVSERFQEFVEKYDFPLLFHVPVIAAGSAGRPSILRKALEGGSETVGTVRLGYSMQPQAERMNTLHGDVEELWITIALMTTARLLAEHPTMCGMVFDSEFPQAVVPGRIAELVAEAEGVFPLVLYPPTYEEPRRPYTKIWDDDDPLLRGLLWHHSKRNHATAHGWIKKIAHACWPGARVWADAQYNTRDTEGVDGIASWTLVHAAPGIPMATAWRVELARAKNRATGSRAEILAGPQLGCAFDQENIRATAPDLYSAAALCSVAAGSDGIVSWGEDCVFDDGGGFRPNGEALWERLGKLGLFYKQHALLIASWRPAPRRIGLLLSTVDDVLESGCNDQSASSVNTHCSRMWHHGRAAQNVFFALLLAGAWPDIVIYKGDGPWEQPPWWEYRVLVAPSVYQATRGLIHRLKSFQDSGGLIITHEGSVLLRDKARRLGLRTGEIQVLDKNYGAHEACPSTLAPYWAMFGTWTFDRYYGFLARLASHLHELLPAGEVLPLFGDGVIGSRMIGPDGSQYAMLVNHSFLPGPEEEWHKGFSHRVGKICDEGVEAVVSLDRFAYEAIGIPSFLNGNGEGVLTRLPIAPGWVEIMRLADEETPPDETPQPVRGTIKVSGELAVECREG